MRNSKNEKFWEPQKWENLRNQKFVLLKKYFSSYLPNSAIYHPPHFCISHSPHVLSPNSSGWSESRTYVLQLFCFFISDSNRLLNRKKSLSHSLRFCFWLPFDVCMYPLWLIRYIFLEGPSLFFFPKNSRKIPHIHPDCHKQPFGWLYVLLGWLEKFMGYHDQSLVFKMIDSLCCMCEDIWL